MFDSDNFSGNYYVYNNSTYEDYTGYYSGSNLTNNLNKQTGYLYFTGTSNLKINLKDFQSDSYTFLLSYERTNNSPCVLFSNLNTGANGQYYGFNACVNSYNNLLIEYYDSNKELKYLSPKYNLDTKGIISFRGYADNIFLSYYNAAYDDLFTEAFSIDNNISPNVSGSIVLASGKFSNLPNYSGYIKDFIFINKNINDSQLNKIIDQFTYNLKTYYTFEKGAESYSYSNYPEDVTHVFDSYVDVTGCFNNTFLDNTGVIYGSITGSNYSLDLTGITGYNLTTPQNLLLLKNKIKKFEYFGDGTALALLQDNTITGWGSNDQGSLYGVTGYAGHWTGSPVGKLTNITDISCKNNFCVALKDDNTVTGWGNNSYGKTYGTILYNNPMNDIFTGNYSDTPLGQLTDITSVKVGYNHSLFLKNDGTLISWGDNSYNQVSFINDRENLSYPLKIQITGIYNDWSYLSGLTLNYTGQYNSKPAYKYTNDLENFGLSLKYNSFINKVIISNSAVDIIGGSVNGIYKRRYPEDLIFSGPNGWRIENEGPNIWFLVDSEHLFAPFRSSDLITWSSWDMTWDGVANNYSISGWTLDYSGLNDEILTTGNTSLPTNNNLNIPYQVVIENSQDTGVNTLYTYSPTFSVNGAYLAKDLPINSYYQIRIDPVFNTNKWSVYDGGLDRILYYNDSTNSRILPLTGWSGNNEFDYYGDITIKPKYVQLDYVYNSDTEGRFTGVFEETVISQLTGISKISVGGYHNIALKADGTVTGWGGEDIGPNPRGGNSLTGVLDISAGNLHTIAILNTNNSITGWGDDMYGQAGDPLGLTGAIQIDAGFNFSTILLANKNLNYYGLVGFGNFLTNVKKYNSSEYGTYAEYITGQQVKNLVSGNAYFNYTIEVERPTIVTETITTIVSQISGYENQLLFSGVTGYNTGWYKDIPDFCGTGFPLYLISGIIGTITGDVLTGIDITTSSSISQRVVLSNQTYQTGFSSGIYDSLKTGNYIYEFNYTNNGNDVNGLENLYLDSGYYTQQSKNILDRENCLITNKNTTLNYNKNYTLEKNIEFLKDFGVDLLLINQLIDNKDIIEIYLFKINSGLNVDLNNSLLMSKSSKDFRFNNSGLNYSVNLNGVAQITGSNYTISNTTLGSPVSFYEFSDNLDGDFIKTNEFLLNYTGQTGQALSTKDFLYLNGQKLISGYQYNFGSSAVSFVTGNIPVTGLIYGFNVLVDYVVYTGNMYTFDLPRFSKNSELIWLNGIKLKSDSYYEISENDSFYNPIFSDKTAVNIYNNTDNYFNE
jgi:alpha-tubulin suppressor-like RCC1 family protein